MKTTVGIPDQLIVDTLISGVEGGIRYWCDRITPQSRHDFYGVLAGQRWTLHDCEEDRDVVLDADRLRAGLVLMATQAPRHFGDMLGEHGDATTGDVLIQFAVFGKIVYG